MVWRSAREFLAGHLSRKEYLGLHLAVGLLLSVVMALAFALVARQVDTSGALTEVTVRAGATLATATVVEVEDVPPSSSLARRVSV